MSNERHLTTSEIDYIVSDIRYTTSTPDINGAINDFVLQPIREALQQIVVAPEMLEQIKQQITKRFQDKVMYSRDEFKMRG
jgi:hypothetical protein